MPTYGLYLSTLVHEFIGIYVRKLSNLLNKMADAIEANLEKLAIAETLDNGKTIRETLNADVPL